MPLIMIPHADIAHCMLWYYYWAVIVFSCYVIKQWQLKLSKWVI